MDNPTKSIGLADLSDVNLTTINNGDLISWNNTTTQFENIAPSSLPPPPIAVSDLTDVNLTSLGDKNILYYDSGVSEWKNTDNYVNLTDAQTITGTKTVTKLRVLDSASDNYYNIQSGSDLTGNYDLTLPGINSNDVIVAESAGQALTNKTIGTKAVIDGSAVADFNSTTKGVLLPRMSFLDIMNIVSPAQGLIVFNNSSNAENYQYYDGTTWQKLHSPQWSSIYFSTPAPTSYALVNTYYKASGTTTEVASSEHFTSTNNRITYIGTRARTIKATCSITAQVASGSKTICYTLAVNGAVQVQATQCLYLTTNRDNNCSLELIYTLNPNDYVEIWTENETDTTSSTIYNAIMNVNTID